MALPILAADLETLSSSRGQELLEVVLGLI